MDSPSPSSDESDYARENASAMYGTIGLSLLDAIAEVLAKGHPIHVDGKCFGKLLPAMEAVEQLTASMRVEVATSVQQLLGRSYCVWPDWTPLPTETSPNQSH